MLLMLLLSSAKRCKVCSTLNEAIHTACVVRTLLGQCKLCLPAPICCMFSAMRSSRCTEHDVAAVPAAVKTGENQDW